MNLPQADPRCPSSNVVRFTKWYLDVAAERRAAIGYWASLHYRDLRVVWQSMTSYAPEEPPSHSWSILRGAEPRRVAASVAWTCKPLRTHFEVDSEVASLSERLWTDDEGSGTVDWCCEVPVGMARVKLPDGSTLAGTGYAERITMTVVPWRLPIRELRWGRWSDHGARRSLVWIEWRGPQPRTWVYLDGQRVDGVITDDAVVGDGFELQLARVFMLESRALAEVLDGLPMLSKVVPATLRDMRESRWFSEGKLCTGGNSIGGRAIHETVSFR